MISRPLFGRISSGEEGKVGYLWKENQDFKTWGGEEYQESSGKVVHCTMIFDNLSFK